jgi:hypothetical protein
MRYSHIQETTTRGYFAHDCLKCKCTRPFLSLNITSKEHVRVGLVGMTVGDDGLGRDLAACDFCGFQIRFKARVVAEAVDWDGDIGNIIRDTKSQLERKDAAPELALAATFLNRTITAVRNSRLSIKNLVVMQPLVALFASLGEIAIYALISHIAIPVPALVGVFLANLAALSLFNWLRWKNTVKALVLERTDRLMRFYKIPLADIQQGFQDVERRRSEPDDNVAKQPDQLPQARRRRR